MESATISSRGSRTSSASDPARRARRWPLLGLAAGAAAASPAPPAPEGQLTWGIHVSLAPTWFDPAETQGIITPFMVLYALHDAMVKPMPGKPQAPCLAESWSASRGRADATSSCCARAPSSTTASRSPPRTSSSRSSAIAAPSHDLMKDKVAAVETPDPPARALQAEGAVARLSDLLCDRQRRRLDRAEEIRREGRRRRVQEGADRRRPLQIRVVQPRRRAGARSLRRLLAQDRRASSAWS